MAKYVTKCMSQDFVKPGTRNIFIKRKMKKWEGGGARGGGIMNCIPITHSENGQGIIPCHARKCMFCQDWDWLGFQAQG